MDGNLAEPSANSHLDYSAAAHRRVVLLTTEDKPAAPGASPASVKAAACASAAVAAVTAGYRAAEPDSPCTAESAASRLDEASGACSDDGAVPP